MTHEYAPAPQSDDESVAMTHNSIPTLLSERAIYPVKNNESITSTYMTLVLSGLNQTTWHIKGLMPAIAPAFNHWEQNSFLPSYSPDIKDVFSGKGRLANNLLAHATQQYILADENDQEALLTYKRQQARIKKLFDYSEHFDLNAPRLSEVLCEIQLALQDKPSNFTLELPDQSMIKSMSKSKINVVNDLGIALTLHVGSDRYKHSDISYFHPHENEEKVTSYNALFKGDYQLLEKVADFIFAAEGKKYIGYDSNINEQEKIKPLMEKIVQCWINHTPQLQPQLFTQSDLTAQTDMSTVSYKGKDFYLESRCNLTSIYTNEDGSSLYPVIGLSYDLDSYEKVEILWWRQTNELKYIQVFKQGNYHSRSSVDKTKSPYAHQVFIDKQVVKLLDILEEMKLLSSPLI